MKDIGKALVKIVGQDNFLADEPMKKHTTFRIGGCARYFVMPDSTLQVQEIVRLCMQEDIPFYIMGNGSNLLVSDEGYDGIIVQLGRNFSEIRTEGTHMHVMAGALLAAVARQALENELEGLEFAAGIPGTIGGAAVMNAGAYGGEMKQVIESVKALDAAGNICVLPLEKLALGYRTSVLQEKNYIVLEVTLKLQKGEKEQIQAKMDDFRQRRIEKQPLEFPSAGSTFKRPEGYFAGKLIMEAGFAGYQVGGARVSEKHCGFVINAGDATAQDVLDLTNEIRHKIYEDQGVMLELEVKKLGRGMNEQ